jgi:uncharacterized protein (TIGR03086 family)
MRPNAPVDIRDLNARAVAASVAVVNKLDASHLDRATPCADWSLGELLAHMTAQHYGFAAAAAGNGADPAAWQVRPLGDDPATKYAAAAAQVVAAFADDRVLEQPFTLPEVSPRRTFPGAQAIGFHFIDYVVHAWDVARSLDLPIEFDREVLDHALAVARWIPDGDNRLAPGAAFRPAVPAPAAGDGTLEQVVALLGRSPEWPGRASDHAGATRPATE